MSERPNIEEALKRVSSRYELVLATAKRALHLMKDSDDIFVRDRVKGKMVKKTFQAIQDVASGKVRIVRKVQSND